MSTATPSSGVLTSALQLLDHLRWIDGRLLAEVVEPYRRRLFEQLFERDERGRLRYTLALWGRGKKNWKSADLVLACLLALLEPTPRRKECYIIAWDEGQAANDLDLLKLLCRFNPILQKYLRIKSDVVDRRDGFGFIRVLPGQAVLGEHGRTYRLLAMDEVHTQRDWDLIEAVQPDPIRSDAQMLFTSYASIFHRPGVPLFDLCQQGWTGQDPRMLFSWYGADRTTDPDFQDTDPETRANPSRLSWADQDYLDQQRRRLPAHKFRRLHLNLPGLPEGSAFSVENVMSAVDRTRGERRPEPGVEYHAFVDMSGGSSDDAVLAIGYQDPDGRAVVCRVMNQGQPPPFDPRLAVERFAGTLKSYSIRTVTGDAYAGQTFLAAFERQGISYQVSSLSKSKLYEALEPALNSHRVILSNVPEVEQQLLGLVWKGGKIDHPPGEHDDWANAVAGVTHLLLGEELGELRLIHPGPQSVAEIEAETAENFAEAKKRAEEAVLDAIKVDGWFAPQPRGRFGRR